MQFEAGVAANVLSCRDRSMLYAVVARNARPEFAQKDCRNVHRNRTAFEGKVRRGTAQKGFLAVHAEPTVNFELLKKELEALSGCVVALGSCELGLS